MKLLICESPGKLSTLKKILGKDWVIKASMGHVTELASGGHHNWGFAIESGKVLCEYELRGDRAKGVVKDLRELAKKAETVFLAMDPDREGEAIAWHLAQQLRLKKNQYQRMCFTQITKKAVLTAAEQTRTLDLDLVHAQMARQCLDKMVGYEVSPLLWRSTGGKSAGRVQSATLHILCEREREREKFVASDYWVLKSVYSEGFEATLHKYALDQKDGDGDETSDEAQQVLSQEKAAEIEKIARESEHLIEKIEIKEEARRPPPPLMTSSLQQLAGARCKFSPKHTMKVAQELYEGLREGEGLITYMRTDSVALSAEFIEETRQWLGQYNGALVPEKPQVYASKAESQGAHEAIRPTDVTLTPDKAKNILSSDQWKLYTLIWERAVASQCRAARLSKSKIVTVAATTTWVAKGLVVLEKGYLEFWNNISNEESLPPLSQGQKLSLQDVKVEKKQTMPPPRFTEPRLIQEMEKRGIGRPSTYASTVTTLKEREYVTLEKETLIPTELGMETDLVLFETLPELVSSEFTAKMEKSLDDIAEGQCEWESYVIGFNESYLSPGVLKAAEVLKERNISVKAVKPSGQSGKANPYWALAPANREKLEKAFEKARRQKTIPSCKLGHGELELRLSRKGVPFWKCTCPGCEETSWYQQLSSEKCPQCHKAFEKIPSKKVKGGSFLKCGRIEEHADSKEVVWFRNRKTGNWEPPYSKPNSPRQNTTESPSPEFFPERQIFSVKALQQNHPLPKDQESILAIRKTLSAVARLMQRGENPPIQIVIAVLRGDTTSTDTLRSLPTFGALSDWSEDKIHQLLDQLIDADCLRYLPSTGAMQLTLYGQKIMREGVASPG